MSVLTHTSAPARPRALAYLQNLAQDRAWSSLEGDAFEWCSAALRGETISGFQASTVIDALLQLPEAETLPAKPVTQVTEEGMYRDGDQLWRVQRSGAGYLYAKRVQVDELPANQWKTTKDGVLVKFHAHFEYVANAVKQLTPAMRLSLDEAQRLGRLWGVCIVCATELTDPKSIAAGIGPVCAKRV